jgi:hypothetical protein
MAWKFALERSKPQLAAPFVRDLVIHDPEGDIDL